MLKNLRKTCAAVLKIRSQCSHTHLYAPLVHEFLPYIASFFVSSVFKIMAILLLLCLGLTGCFSAVQSETPTTYVLTSIPTTTITAKKSSARLLVKTPQANSVYNTTQMAYVSSRYQLSYFVKNRWVATPSQMLLPLMIQTLQNTHAFRAVIPQAVIGRADLVLDTQLLQLQQEFTQPTSQVRLVMRAELSNVNSQRILATREFTIIEPATANDPYAGVVATNRAVNKFLQQLAAFCVSRK